MFKRDLQYDITDIITRAMSAVARRHDVSPKDITPETYTKEIERAFLAAVERAKPKRKNIYKNNKLWNNAPRQSHNQAIDEYHNALVKEITGE